MSRSSVSIILDKRRISTTGENKGKYPIKIKVNFKVRDGKTNKYVVRRYHIEPEEVFCRESEFAKAQKQSSVILAHAKAVELFSHGLSVEDFERLYKSSGNLDEIKTVFEAIIDQLEAEERDGNAILYKNAMNSFIEYKGEHITFGTITPEWLRGYERWALKKGLSINTVGIYCRHLRAVCNVAIDKKLMDADAFPFGRRKYIIPSGPRQTKKAFTKEERDAILSHRSDRDDVNMALDYWAFQYFANGCNMADVAYMQRKDIDGDTWRFERKKTENTERRKETIDVHINARMREIIARHGNRSLDPDSYIFPILEPGMTSRQRKLKIIDFIKDINELLAIALEEINKGRDAETQITVKLTSGTARYTAATILRKQGIDLSLIAKALGHGSEATTEKYTEEEKEIRLLISNTLAN